MLKQPLFGEDSSPHITSMFLSGIITLIGWILFCILSLVIKFKPQTPQYKEVQIVLSSTPVVEKSEPSAVPELVEGLVEEAAAAAEESVLPEPVEGQPVEAPEIPNPVETPVAVAKVEAPKATPAPAKTQSQPAKTTDPSKKVDFDNMTYAKDYSDFSFNNTSSSSSKDSFDWSQFEDSDTENVQVSQKVDKVTNTSSISGSAASSSTANQRQTSSNSSSSSSSNPNASASNDISQRLSDIKNTTTATSGGSSSSSNNQQKFSSDLDITWNGGVTRKQIGSLSIDLKESGSDIKERKTTVTIEFTVDEKGYTIAGTIKITPESILPESVRKEVISEISKWRFIEGPSRSVATFEYTIEKR